MKRLHRLQTFAAMFLVAQVVVGYAGWFTPRHEIYPFTSWLLFSLVPDRLSDYDLLLHGSPAYPQEPPRSFNQSAGLVRAPHSIVSYQVIQQLGEAVAANDSARVDYLRGQIEEQFAVAPMRYDLIKVSYHPVDRWKTGRILSSSPVQSFTAAKLPLALPGVTPAAATVAVPVEP
jgi:hypothetical protein